MTTTLVSLFVYFVLPITAGIATVYSRRRARAASLLPELADEDQDLRGHLREVIRAAPRTPALLTTATSSPLSLLVEARLLAGCPFQALEEIEEEVGRSPNDGAAFVAMAKALLYCNQIDEARGALRWAQRLGADDPELDYLRARLGRQDVGALRLCLRACRREPSYAEALYLCARLCLRLGFHAEGARLLRRIAPLMHLSVDRISYRQDLEALGQGEARRGPARRLLSRLSPAARRPGPGRGASTSVLYSVHDVND